MEEVLVLVEPLHRQWLVVETNLVELLMLPIPSELLDLAEPLHRQWLVVDTNLLELLMLPMPSEHLVEELLVLVEPLHRQWLVVDTHLVELLMLPFPRLQEDAFSAGVSPSPLRLWQIGSARLRSAPSTTPR